MEDKVYKSNTYTDEQIKYIIELKQQDLSWDNIARRFNKKYDDEKTSNAIRKTYYRFEDFEFSTDEFVTNIRKAYNASKGKAVVAKENKALLEFIEGRETLLSDIRDLLKSARFTKPKQIRVKKDRKKRNMTMEVMLTDLHYGKKTKWFNSERAKECAQKMGNVVISEVKRNSANYNVEEIITYLGGDMIENSDFHGVESRMASEFGNSEQVRLAIHSLFEDYIVKLASTGRKLTFICVPGNHDRPSMNKSFQDPGKENLTWIIYHTLNLLCKTANIKADFIIPEGIYVVHEVYGNKVLYEHGDFIKGGMTRVACENHLAKRSKQFGMLIDYLRIGHYHEPTMYGRGRIIVNGSFPGQDSYSEINGYSSESVQIINYYVETENRPTSYYHSFPVFLG